MTGRTPWRRLLYKLEGALHGTLDLANILAAEVFRFTAKRSISFGLGWLAEVN
jgi:hypothetical protein